jgi:hypothetical protein
MPKSFKASITASNLNGLVIASIFFIRLLAKPLSGIESEGALSALTQFF